jgi:hypothetical protein
VTQNRATSPLSIYNALTEDNQFMSYVGTYVFKSGNAQASAISILSPGEDLPNLKSQTGLEVVIHDVGEVRSRSYITGELDTIVSWRVFLIAWEGTTGEIMMNATRRIMQKFGNAYNLQSVATPNGIGALVQTMILIPNDAPILNL